MLFLLGFLVFGQLQGNREEHDAASDEALDGSHLAEYKVVHPHGDYWLAVGVNGELVVGHCKRGLVLEVVGHEAEHSHDCREHIDPRLCGVLLVVDLAEATSDFHLQVEVHNKREGTHGFTDLVHDQVDKAITNAGE